MQMNIRKIVFLSLYLCLLSSAAFAANAIASVAQTASTAVRSGESIQSSLAASFAPFPSDWVVEQNVMDPIWEPLGFKGVNFYAYGGPKAPYKFSARSDPESPLYQAWLGAYVVSGSKAEFDSGNKGQSCEAILKLAVYDQRSWLGAMGDPNPLASAEPNPQFSSILIDGSDRTMCSVDMRSHSDIGPDATPLAKHIGMPPIAQWKDVVPPFHNLILHVSCAWWYDQRRDVTVIVYSASSAFKRKSGRERDNGHAISSQLREMMSKVHILDVAAVQP